MFSFTGSSLGTLIRKVQPLKAARKNERAWVDYRLGAGKLVRVKRKTRAQGKSRL